MRKFVTEKIVKFKIYTIIAEKIIVKFLYVKKKTQIQSISKCHAKHGKIK